MSNIYPYVYVHVHVYYILSDSLTLEKRQSAESQERKGTGSHLTD